LPANTRVLGEKKPETVTFDDLPVRVAVHGQSFKPGPVLDNLAAAYPPPARGCYNIGLLHTSLTGNSDHDPYAPCTLEELTSRGYDYWALGHIHRRAVLSRDPYVVFPGNLQGRHARESGAKGCFVVDVDDAGRTASLKFVALDVVRWLRADVGLKGRHSEADLVEGLREALQHAKMEADDRTAAVRVTLTGHTSLHALIERRPHRLRQTAIEIADEIAGDDLWIEKIVNDTAAFEGGAGLGDEAHDLISIMQEIAGNAEQIGPLLAKELEPLRARLPGDLKELDAFKLIETPALCQQMLDRLQPRLAVRLAGEEDG
jgi:DNA repair exonuclease SbcCD nuclease subunit